MKLAVLPTDISFEFMLGYHSLGLILFIFDPFPVRMTQTILQTAQLSPSQHINLSSLGKFSSQSDNLSPQICVIFGFEVRNVMLREYLRERKGFWKWNVRGISVLKEESAKSASAWKGRHLLSTCPGQPKILLIILIRFCTFSINQSTILISNCFLLWLKKDNSSVAYFPHFLQIHSVTLSCQVTIWDAGGRGGKQGLTGVSRGLLLLFIVGVNSCRSGWVSTFSITPHTFPTFLRSLSQLANLNSLDYGQVCK